MNRMIMCTGLALTVAALAHAATDDENELLAQLAVAQSNYHQAIETMHDVGVQIASLEQHLAALIRANTSILSEDQRISHASEIRRVRWRLATLLLAFEDAELDMDEALADIEAIYRAMGALHKGPEVGTGG